MKLRHPGLPGELVSTHTAARLLGVSIRHVQRLVAHGELEGVNVGAPSAHRPTYRVVARALDDLVDRGNVNPEPELEAQRA